MDGSEEENCNDADGQCACKEHIAGAKCDECEAGFSMNGFPTCQVCSFTILVMKVSLDLYYVKSHLQ